MKPMFLFLLSMAFSIGAQTVVVSKDSLKVHNIPVMSSIDQIVFKNTGSQTTFCDSAWIQFLECDTSGGFSWDTANVKVIFEEINHGREMGIPVLSLRRVDSNEYRLLPMIRMKSAQSPFTMNPSGDSTVLSNMQIVNCPACTPPKYPRTVNGVLRMFFHGGSTVAVRLRPQSLPATAVRCVAPLKLRSTHASGGVRVLPNGKKIPGDKGMKSPRRIQNRICTPDK